MIHSNKNEQGGYLQLLTTRSFSFSADTTGTESVYTVYEGHEIMFHISTMLPYSQDNKQQVSTFLTILVVLIISYSYIE